MLTSRASAVWEGKLKDGKGTFKAASGAFSGPYTFATRFEGAKGTTPEELIVAAYAACFSMALSADLEQAGKPATRIASDGVSTFEKGDGGFKITRIDLTVRGKVPGIDQAAFSKAAEATKTGCPVSKALRGNVELRVEAVLE